MILFLFTVYLFIYFNNIRNLFSSLHIYFNVGRCYIFKTIFTSFFSFLVVIFRSSTLLLVNDVVICDDCLQRKMEMSSTGIFSVSLKLYPGRYEVVNFAVIWSILLWPLE